jgi:hypothetical protein
VVLPGDGSVCAFRGTVVAPVLIRCHSSHDLSLVTCLAQRTDNWGEGETGGPRKVAQIMRSLISTRTGFEIPLSCIGLLAASISV